jgi:hypothetical protein
MDARVKRGVLSCLVTTFKNRTASRGFSLLKKDVLEYRLCLAALPADLELDQRGEELYDHLPVPGGPLHQPHQVGQEGPTGPLSSASIRGPSALFYRATTGTNSREL